MIKKVTYWCALSTEIKLCVYTPSTVELKVQNRTRSKVDSCLSGDKRQEAKLRK